MATIVLSVLLLAAGLALVFFQAEAINLVRGVGLPGDIQSQIVDLMTQKTVAWALLAAAPILLIVGSLTRGV